MSKLLQKFATAAMDFIKSSNKEHSWKNLWSRPDVSPGKDESKAYEIFKFTGYHTSALAWFLMKNCCGGMAVYSFQYYTFLKNKEDVLERYLVRIDNNLTLMSFSLEEQIACVDEKVQKNLKQIACVDEKVKKILDSMDDSKK